MDSLINAAARALAVGDPLSALNRIALRNDAPALALRGIAMAQLGDLGRAKDLLQRAARAFGPSDAVARARCIVAQAEIALVSRDLNWPTKSLESARALLARRGDRLNAAHAGCLVARRLLLIGRIAEAARVLAEIDPATLSPAMAAAYELALAAIAIRNVQTRAARAALARAATAARQAGIAPLSAEVDGVARWLSQPAARIIARGNARVVALDEVETLLASDALVVDACRNVARFCADTVSLASRPVLFALLRTLAEGWPGDVGREVLIRAAFRGKRADDSHRARLRVEIGRLRSALGGRADIHATGRGFALVPRGGAEVVVLAPIAEERHATVLALLADGESWSSSALALALGISPRSVQRALDRLAAAGQVSAVGLGPARRWMTPPVPGFPTALLLPGPLPDG